MAKRATTLANDALSRLIGKSDPGGQTQAMTYDIADQRITLVDPDNFIRAVSYDVVGRSVNTSAPGGFSAMTGYDPSSRVVSQTYYSGTIRNTIYDGADEILQMIDINSRGSVLARWAFGYDLAGNRSTISDLIGTITTYLYDAKNRLMDARIDGNGSQHYYYILDAMDNILTSSERGVIDWTYDLSNRMMTALTTLGYVTYA